MKRLNKIHNTQKGKKKHNKLTNKKPQHTPKKFEMPGLIEVTRNLKLLK